MMTMGRGKKKNAGDYGDDGESLEEEKGSSKNRVEGREGEEMEGVR